MSVTYQEGQVSERASVQKRHAATESRGCRPLQACKTARHQSELASLARSAPRRYALPTEPWVREALAELARLRAAERMEGAATVAAARKAKLELEAANARVEASETAAERDLIATDSTAAASRPSLYLRPARPALQDAGAATDVGPARL